MSKYLAIFLTLFIVSGANAQQFKIIGGTMISNYTEKWPREGFWPQNTNLFRNPFQNSKTGFLAGVGIEFAVDKNIAIEIDGLYFQKGSSFLYSRNWWPSPATMEDIYNMSGVSFPILANMKFLPRPFPYILGGIELSFILSHTRIIKEKEASISRGTWENIFEYTEKADFGLVFGIGFEMKVSKVLCFFEGRYNVGQGNLYTGPASYPYRPRIKTCALEIITGFKI